MKITRTKNAGAVAPASRLVYDNGDLEARPKPKKVDMKGIRKADIVDIYKDHFRVSSDRDPTENVTMTKKQRSLPGPSE